MSVGQIVWKTGDSPIKKTGLSWRQIGIQGKPNMRFEINGEDIQLGNTGVYELLSDDVIVQSIKGPYVGSNKNKTAKVKFYGKTSSTNTEFYDRWGWDDKIGESDCLTLGQLCRKVNWVDWKDYVKIEITIQCKSDISPYGCSTPAWWNEQGKKTVGGLLDFRPNDIEGLTAVGELEFNNSAETKSQILVSNMYDTEGDIELAFFGWKEDSLFEFDITMTAYVKDTSTTDTTWSEDNTIVLIDYSTSSGGTGNFYQGIQGPQGPIGATGSTGPQGAKGEKGDQGAKGEKGDQGDQGASLQLKSITTGTYVDLAAIKANPPTWIAAVAYITTCADGESYQIYCVADNTYEYIHLSGGGSVVNIKKEKDTSNSNDAVYSTGYINDTINQLEQSTTSAIATTKTELESKDEELAQNINNLSIAIDGKSDSDTTYTLSQDENAITLTGSDSSVQSIDITDTTYSIESTGSNSSYKILLKNNITNETESLFTISTLGDQGFLSQDPQSIYSCAGVADLFRSFLQRTNQVDLAVSGENNVLRARGEALDSAANEELWLSEDSELVNGAIVWLYDGE